MQRSINIFTIIVVLITAKVCFASNVDPELLCLIASSHYEKKYNIPTNLLRSISIAESGKWNREHKMSFAWPWMIGIDGRGKVFETYTEAAAFLRKAVAAGENVDIGCHQINWKHHGHNFRRPEDLLHPKTNAAYAAHFLIEKFQSAKSWNQAIAHYHSHTPEFGNKYFKKVLNIFEDMKGPVGQKYANYIAFKTQKFKDNYVTKKSFKNDVIQQQKSLMLTSDNSQRKSAKNESNIMIYVKDVELPANSVIVSNSE